MKKTAPKQPSPNSSEEWETPQGLYAKLDFIYTFTLDVCASAANKKCARYFDKKIDGLAQSWRNERCWLNPPYARGKIRDWMKKAYEESLLGALIVCLVPAYTETEWWHDYAERGEITFLRKRLKFQLDGNNGKSGPRFSSAIVVFKPALTNRDIIQKSDV